MDNVHDLIIATLSHHNSSLTITEIAGQTRINRHTIARQLDTLEILGKVRKIQHGNAKKYYLVSSVPVSGLIDISSDLIVIVDKDLNIQYINSAAEKKLGLSISMMAGERIDSLNADLFSSQEVIEGLKSHSPNKVFRTEIAHSNGCIYGITILELSLQVGKNLISITAEDITEKKKAEREIIESEEKYKALFQATADPVFLVDQENGYITDVNQAACQIYGYDREVFLQMQIMDILAQPGITGKNILKPVHFSPLDYHRHQSGRVFPVEVSAVKVRVNEKDIIIATCRDITKRIMAAEALSQVRKNFETFFNTVEDFLFVVDEKGIIIEVNDTVVHKLGYAKSEIIGTPVTIVHPPELCEKASQIISDILAGIEDSCTIPLITKNGRCIPVETAISRGQWNGKSALFGVSKDITQVMASEEKFSKAFHFSPVAKTISSIDDGRFIEVNDTFLHLSGYSREEVIGKNIHDLKILTSDDPFSVLKKLIQENKTVSNYEIKITTKSGDIRNTFLSANQITIGDENVLLTSLVDITALRKTEKALKRSEKRYQTLFDSSPDAIFVIDQETGKICDVNPAASRMYGYDHHELITMKNTDLSDEPEKTRDATINPIKHIPLRYHRHKNGRIIPVEITMNILKLHEKTYILATIRDITRRLEMENALQKSEEQFRLLAGAIEEVFWLADADIKNIFYVSPGYERVWGRTRNSLYSNPRSFIDAIHEEDRGRVLSDLEAEKKGLAFDHEYRIIHPDGNIRHIWDRGFPVRDDSMKISRYAGIAMDITERVNSEKERRNTDRKVHLLTELTRHDIFNQINALLLFLDQARSSPDLDMMHKYLDMAEEAGTRIEIISNLIRDFENFEITSVKWIRLHHIISASIQEVHLQEITIDNQTPDNFEIFTDLLIIKTFSTLIENSIRHGGALTTIRISLTDDGANKVIIYEDNGKGIPDEEKDFIFEHGYGKHTGIGLYLAKELLHISGFSIRENGEYGKGARFEVIIPKRNTRISREER